MSDMTELAALEQCVAALEAVTDEERARMLRYLAERYELTHGIRREKTTTATPRKKDDP